MKKEELLLVQEWDKTFPKSSRVDHCKVTFVNRYGITLAADMYVPENAEGKLPAIAVCGPFGAVKEQCSGLYAQTMAERGFLTIAFDPSFTGESGGNVRYMASPDINTEDFMAAVDFLSLCDKAHSCYFGKDAYADMVRDSKYTDNKELLIIPGASHTDLYDGGGKDAIPFDKLESFFTEYLK